MDGGIRVLHVDDEPGFTDTAASLIGREDDRLTVETTTSAAEGMARIADGEIDCVVSGYDMPRTDGLEFLDAVREERPDLPFVLFTGKGSEAVASDAISGGATDSDDGGHVEDAPDALESAEEIRQDLVDELRTGDRGRDAPGDG